MNSPYPMLWFEDQAEIDRLVQAMLQMVKLDIAVLEAAGAG